MSRWGRPAPQRHTYFSFKETRRRSWDTTYLLHACMHTCACEVSTRCLFHMPCLISALGILYCRRTIDKAGRHLRLVGCCQFMFRGHPAFTCLPSLTWTCPCKYVRQAAYKPVDTLENILPGWLGSTRSTAAVRGSSPSLSTCFGLSRSSGSISQQPCIQFNRPAESMVSLPCYGDLAQRLAVVRGRWSVVCKGSGSVFVRYSGLLSKFESIWYVLLDPISIPTGLASNHLTRLGESDALRRGILVSFSP